MNRETRYKVRNVLKGVQMGDLTAMQTENMLRTEILAATDGRGITHPY